MCLSGSAKVSEPLEMSDTGDFSGKIGQPIAISVSRSGLTLASFYAFAPVLLVLAVVAVITEIAEPAWMIELASIALSALCLAAYLSRALLKQSVPRLLDVQTALQELPAGNRTELERKRDQTRDQIGITAAIRGNQ